MIELPGRSQCSEVQDEVRVERRIGRDRGLMRHPHIRVKRQRSPARPPPQSAASSPKRCRSPDPTNPRLDLASSMGQQNYGHN
ncbi:hypothetical protein DAI22_05g154201 [Oryza sativa Japonica Group]|nr:hypothetical protein DAI22_05g154201 [Oryza sativa Japonica Group]